nr:thioredoxin-interacting protein-like isoform X1 [Pan troglodytes]
MVMFKKIKSFEVVFNDPEKVYGSGEKVAGRVIVEVCEVTRVKAVRILACGVAKVLWMQGSQQCKQTSEYLRYEDTLLLEDQPTDVQKACWGNIVNIETPVRRTAARMVGLVWPRPCWGKPRADVPQGLQERTASTRHLIHALCLDPA